MSAEVPIVHLGEKAAWQQMQLLLLVLVLLPLVNSVAASAFRT